MDPTKPRTLRSCSDMSTPGHFRSRLTTKTDTIAESTHTAVQRQGLAVQMHCLLKRRENRRSVVHPDGAVVQAARRESTVSGVSL